MGHENTVVYDTDGMTVPTTDGTLWSNRLAGYSQYDAPGVPVCSVIVQAYNRLGKTKSCVDCVLKYTADVDYELILVDNGSSDGTLEYFEAVPYEKKQVIRVTKNIGASYPFSIVRNVAKGKYLVVVNNDVLVTKNWLSNLLRCATSEPGIGLVLPLSNNVSNFQEYDLGGWKDFDEMQEKAAKHNVSNPSLWEERMRLITILGFYSRDVLDNVGIWDFAYKHDFAEDDTAVRLRRMGYKLMLCKDTWVCHDHDFRNLEDKDPLQFEASLESGRRIYKEKYHGIDPWDDILNFESPLLAAIGPWALPQNEINALCVDVRCGTPVLEVRNHLKRRGRTDVRSWAFTTKAKYFLDLQTTGAKTACDRVDFIQNHYAEATFDIVMLGEPLNTYPRPVMLLRRLHSFLKRGGLLLFKLRNTYDFNALMRAADLDGKPDVERPSLMSYEEVAEKLKQLNMHSVNIGTLLHNLNQQDVNRVKAWLGGINPDYNDTTLQKLTTYEYMFSSVKG